MGVYEEHGTPDIDPQIGGFPFHKDPKKVPLISETPSWHLLQTMHADGPRLPRCDIQHCKPRLCDWDEGAELDQAWIVHESAVKGMRWQLRDLVRQPTPSHKKARTPKNPKP